MKYFSGYDCLTQPRLVAIYAKSDFYRPHHRRTFRIDRLDEQAGFASTTIETRLLLSSSIVSVSLRAVLPLGLIPATASQLAEFSISPSSFSRKLLTGCVRQYAKPRPKNGAADS